METCWQLHNIIEEEYIAHPAKSGDAAWLEKRRLLLADMAIHLLQTAIEPGDIKIENLTNNLNAILTISDPFLPNAELKRTADKLYKR